MLLKKTANYPACLPWKPVTLSSIIFHTLEGRQHMRPSPSSCYTNSHLLLLWEEGIISEIHLRFCIPFSHSSPSLPPGRPVINSPLFCSFRYFFPLPLTSSLQYVQVFLSCNIFLDLAPRLSLPFSGKLLGQERLREAPCSPSTRCVAAASLSSKMLGQEGVPEGALALCTATRVPVGHLGTAWFGAQAALYLTLCFCP